MASLRQIAANRLNAGNSTGPTSDEGKTVSRANAVKHGLAGSGTVLPDEDAAEVDARMSAWRDSLRPSTAEDEWLFEQVVVSSVRVDRCRRDESEVRTHEVRRALLCWDDDRRLDAEETASALAKRPGLTVRRLRRSRQGCDWLIGRWQALGAAFDANADWTEAQRSLALDLLGTPADLRDAAPLESPRELVAREVAGLERLCAEALVELDDADRAAAELGMEIEPSRALSRLRRYEASCLRRYQWARNRLTTRPYPAPFAPVLAPPPLPVPPPPPPRPEPACPADESDASTQAPAGVTVAAIVTEAPAAPRPLLNHTFPTPLPFVNRRMRRAAEKIAGRSR